jgi:chitin synthase
MNQHYDNQPYNPSQPYDPPYAAHPQDPFATPGGGYHSPPPTHDVYGVPLPQTVHSPPPQTDYLNAGIQPQPQYISPQRHASGFDLHDDGPQPQAQEPFDGGDIPLLQRGNSGASASTPMPGGYAENDEPGTNIRYGRIPQRVPRRLKTMKKVE